ncbi:MAG: potassium-transporting ATPase subunit KdpA [Planctomycetes bacterium]|nr:potassium-transporting ATPase subunit KdpA [Planctomycetota bacterium]
MNPNAWIQLAIYLIVLVALVKPLGWYMARVYQGQPCGLDRVLGWLEPGIYRLAGIDQQSEMGWKTYAFVVLLFNAIGLLAVYALQRLQGLLPFNPQDLDAVPPDLAFNTAVSFASNTNWQNYSGETTLSYLTQMVGLGVQNFVSAATGMAVLVALIRGLTRHSPSPPTPLPQGARGDSATIGNFWVDLVRSNLYILLPLSFVLALLLVSQGVVQNFQSYQQIDLVQTALDADKKPVTTQTLPMGPAASQIAIKQLGTNGGGFFNVNGAHPYENATPLSNFLELLAILLIPAALCYTFGVMVGDTRQGWAVLAAMMVVFVPLTIGCIAAEQAGNPAIDREVRFPLAGRASDGSQLPSLARPANEDEDSGGNMEGKEVRFGIASSALWACATTAASNGSVNSMHDSYTPLGGLIPMWLMQLGEVIFGGVGSGLYGMLMFVIVAVFVAGLMVGRTPEYLGKKIEAFEMKMASLVILIPPLVVLVGTAIAVLGPGLEYTDKGEMKNPPNPGAHGFSEVLYAFSSAGNNNGSAFAGLNGNNLFYNTALGIAMLISRYWLIIPTLAIAGSLARKKYTPSGAGTLPTHTPLFVVLIAGTVLLVGALTFVPALALGPVAEHLQMTAGNGAQP